MDRVTSLEREIDDIRRVLQQKEIELQGLKTRASLHTNGQQNGFHCQPTSGTGHCGRLPKWAIERYSRQILLPDIGVAGQERLCVAKVLVVGAGGLGCPAAVYLAGAGIGEIGIVDYDTVDLSNIHRQFLHGECDQGVTKAESAANALRKINSRIKITPYNIQLDSSNALEIVSQYDVVLDCSDNVPTRYLLNDACVLNKKPLISGSALKMEGQVTIYGYRPNRHSNPELYVGACYRCMFPSPPPAESVGSCAGSGVAGPLTGVIGALQALETIKYIVSLTHHKLLVERMVLFDGEDMTVRTVKLRGRSSDCAVCSDNPTITKLIDYELFCNARAQEKNPSEVRVITQRRKEEKERRMTGQPYLGFRVTQPDGKRKWVQDVPKEERRMGPKCSKFCEKNPNRSCGQFSEERRREIFSYFWYKLDWAGKKDYVKNLIEIVKPKRRRKKEEASRKGDSKVYYLILKETKLKVCRVMFLNTLGIKEAMVRTWLSNRNTSRNPKKPVKSINIESYLDELAKYDPKCQFCQQNNIFYIDLDGVKNVFQLYQRYVKDMKLKGVQPSSRKTFCNVFGNKNLRIFKPKNFTDVCDLVAEHNIMSVEYPVLDTNIVLDKAKDVIPVDNLVNVDYYYNNEQW